MKFCYERLGKQPRNFHRIADVSIEEFEEIILRCEKAAMEQDNHQTQKA